MTQKINYRVINLAIINIPFHGNVQQICIHQTVGMDLINLSEHVEVDGVKVQVQLKQTK